MPTADGANSRRERWLLLIQQLPTHPTSVRIKTWRRLQQIGSVVLKNSVYVLPHTPQAREDFEWLCAEIQAAQGHASILVAEALTGEQEEAIRRAFRAARSEDYEALRSKTEELLREAAARPRGTARPSLRRALRACRDELARIDAIDFCGAPARPKAVESVDALEAKLMSVSPKPPMLKPAAIAGRRDAYRKRIWVTRPRPGVDRMACAWLILRFVDPAARFVFADVEASRVAPRQIPFDMFGAEFGHQGDRCSFETLCDRFGIKDPAVQRIAEIVHDVDLKDRRYNPSEARIVADLIEGLRTTYKDDHKLLEHGIALFAGFYESFGRSVVVPLDRKHKKRSGPRTRAAGA